jgi:hypothetical protein
MTIKARNRFYLVFFACSLALLVLFLILFHYQKFTGQFEIPEVYLKPGASQSFLTGYRPFFSFLSIFIQMFYVCGTSFMIIYAFYKTQAGELGYFLLFLISLQLDCLRITIPLLQLSNTYSAGLATIANLVFTGIILSPISLLALVLFSTETYRQSLEQNCIIILVAATFIAFAIPLNTGILLPNFSISCSFKKIVWMTYLIFGLIAVISLFINNYKYEIPQLMTLGFFLLELGTLILRQSYTLLNLIFAVIILGAGTFIYFKELHNRYLWDN